VTTTSPPIPNHPDQPADRSSAKWRLWLPLVAILILAAALRIPGLGHDSLWGDECLSVTIAKMPLDDLIRHVIWWEQIPPLHHIVLKLWMSVFGSSEAAVRMPSALAGITAVAWLYVFIARVLGRRAAFAAALILAVSPVHIAFAHEARTYTLTFFLAIVATDLFERLLHNYSPHGRNAYIIVATLLLYAHLYGVFVLAAHNLTYLIFAAPRKSSVATRWSRWIGIDLAIALLYAPWVPTVLAWYKSVNISFWVKAASWDDITAAYWVYAGSAVMLVLFAAAAVLGIRSAWKQNRQALVLLCMLLFLPVLVPAAMSVLTHPSFAPRYGMVACAGLFPLVGAGLASLPCLLRMSSLIAISAICIVTIDGPATKIPKTPWREAIAYLDAVAAHGDIVVNHIKAGSRLYNYYNIRPDLPPRPFDTPTLPVSHPLKPGQHIWFVFFEQWYPLRAMLQRGQWDVVAHRRFGDLLLMELTDSPAAATQP